MPTYGYECLSCDREFEVFQSMKDDPLKTCDACGGTLRKRIYPVGIAFKGPGFYVNDYARKSEPAAKADAKPDAGAKPDADAKPDGGGEKAAGAASPGGEASSSTAEKTAAPAAPAGAADSRPAS